MYTIDETRIIYADLNPDEGVVLNLNTKNYYRLNETGQVIWQALADGKEAGEIARSIAEQYDVTEKEAAADVGEILRSMTEERLVSLAGNASPAFDVDAARREKRGNAKT